MRDNVLIIDDEEVICDLGKEMFEIFDITATSAQTMVESVDYFKEHFSEIGLVILDLNLKECTGIDVFNALREIDPTLNAVIASGQFIESDAQKYTDLGFKEIILKPYTMGTVQEMIGKYLG